MTKEDFEQKKNEKVQLMRDTFKEKGKLEAMMIMQDQLDYVDDVYANFKETPFGKYLDENSKKVDEADKIISARKTPFALELFKCSRALMITIGVGLIISLIIDFISNRFDATNMLITYWFAWLFYGIMDLYLSITLKVKFPKCSKKDKKVGLELLEEYRNEVAIVHAMSAVLDELKSA